MSPMHCAASGGHLEIVRYFRVSGVSFIAEAGGQRNTALHEAARKGHAVCAKFIVDCGFAADISDSLAKVTQQ